MDTATIKLALKDITVVRDSYGDQTGLFHRGFQVPMSVAAFRYHLKGKGIVVGLVDTERSVFSIDGNDWTEDPVLGWIEIG